MDVVRFDAGDDPYFAWMEAHRTGFVLNTEQTVTSRLSMLHRSGCMHIRPGPSLAPGAYTERDYIKICADDLTALGQWITQYRPHAHLTVCSTCMPPLVSPQAVYPDQVERDHGLWEGATKRVLVNAYERNAQARQQCIDHYGAHCSVCNLRFGDVYGPLGDGFIQVHHLRPLATIAERYQVDPIADLRPVCPNCHAMLHRAIGNPYTIEALREIIADRRQQPDESSSV